MHFVIRPLLHVTYIKKNIYIILCIFALYHLYARQKESSLKDNFYEYNVVFLDLLKRFSVRKN